MNRRKLATKTKKITGFIVLAFLCAGADAQFYYGPPPPAQQGRPVQEEPKDSGPASPSGYISINIGAALPESQFATGYGLGYGGYAQTGLVYTGAFAFPINHSNFGIALMIGSYSNGYDLDTYVNNLNYSNQNYEYQSVYPDYNTYETSSIMGGLSYTYPIGRLSFDGRVMIGALLCSLPEQDYAAEDAQGDIYEYDLQSSNTVGLAFDVGVGVRCFITKIARRQLCAMVNLDYLYSDPSYSTVQNVYETPAANNPNQLTYQLVPSPSFSGHLPVSLLNITFGLGYQIGR